MYRMYEEKVKVEKKQKSRTSKPVKHAKKTSKEVTTWEDM